MKIKDISAIKITIRNLTEIKKLITFFKNLNENISEVVFTINNPNVFSNIFKNEESRTFKKDIFKQEVNYRYKKTDVKIKMNHKSYIKVDGQKIDLFLPFFEETFLDYFLVQKKNGQVVKYYL
jgi:hypothetical protein